MNAKEKVIRINHQSNCSVFTVKNNFITKSNMIAMQHCITPGMNVCDLIYTGLEDYKRYKRGTLYITIRANNIIYNATVVKCGTYDTFILDSDFVAPHNLQIHHLSEKLRKPLSEAMLCMNELSNDSDIGDRLFMNQLKQNIYQIHRSLCNMTAQPDYAMERKLLSHNQNLTELVENLIIEIQRIINKAGYKMKCAIPNRHILCSLDWDSFRHAFVNMLANAMKYSRPTKTIHVKMVKYDTYCTLSVTNFFEDPTLIDKFDIFTVLSHDPFCRNPADGTGLGLNIMRAAAMAHNGSLLMESTNPNTMRLTLSIPVEIHAQNRYYRKLHTYRHLPVSYTGGYDMLLTEFSELLTPESFK